jgi:hypothetical protein
MSVGRLVGKDVVIVGLPVFEPVAIKHFRVVGVFMHLYFLIQIDDCLKLKKMFSTAILQRSIKHNKPIL